LPIAPNIKFNFISNITTSAKISVTQSLQLTASPKCRPWATPTTMYSKGSSNKVHRTTG